jgi:peptidoglycan/LPS O-acetylase OafA/YrhL
MDLDRDPSLDGLRGIAALWVFATHATYSNLLPHVLNFRGAGRGGVILFFFLSAFLLSGPFFAQAGKALSWRAWVHYWSRRLFRIVPLYYLVVLVLWLGHLNPFNDLDEGSATSLLIQHLTFQKGMSVFWSIITEMRFYVVLPILLIFTALVREKLKLGRFPVLLIGSCWVASVAAGLVHNGYLLHLGVDQNAPVFMLGALTALLGVKSPLDSAARARRWMFECLAWISAVAFVCNAMPAVYASVTTGSSISDYAGSSAFYEAFWTSRVPWIGLPLGLCFLSYPRGTGQMKRLLSWRPLTWVGRVSFGLYLIHVTVIEQSRPIGIWLPPTIRLIVDLGLSLGISYALFLLLEDPLITVGRRLPSRLLDARYSKSQARESNVEDRSDPATRALIDADHNGRARQLSNMSR